MAKIDLINKAKELGIDVDESMKVKEINKLIDNSEPTNDTLEVEPTLDMLENRVRELEFELQTGIEKIREKENRNLNLNKNITKSENKIKLLRGDFSSNITEDELNKIDNESKVLEEYSRQMKNNYDTIVETRGNNTKIECEIASLVPQILKFSLDGFILSENKSYEILENLVDHIDCEIEKYKENLIEEKKQFFEANKMFNKYKIDNYNDRVFLSKQRLGIKDRKYPKKVIGNIVNLSKRMLDYKKLMK